jgi:uncharacterized membrane protein YbhN (UPF0104 family)
LWLALAVLLEVASTLSFAAAFRGAIDRRGSVRTSVDMAMTAQGVNVLLPAGGTSGLAVVALVMTRAGVPRHFAVSRTVAVFLLTSLATFAERGRIGRRVQAARVHLVEGVAAALELLRRRDLLAILGSAGYLAFDVAALAVSFEALGGGALPVGALVLAYTLGHAGAIVPFPGSAESGLLGMFVLFGASLPVATAAILLYRAVALGVPAVSGLAGIADLRRQLRHAPPREEVALRYAA